MIAGPPGSIKCSPSPGYIERSQWTAAYDFCNASPIVGQLPKVEFSVFIPLWPIGRSLLPMPLKLF